MTLDEEWLTRDFDCVVMMTWSNWATEPRSNRYHYATRFAQRLPVYFLQNTPARAGLPMSEPAGEPGITVVHLGADYGSAQTGNFLHLLKSRGHKRPLYWIYNPGFMDICQKLPSSLKIYHATEDYLGRHKDMTFVDEPLVKAFLDMIASVDLVVAVSDSVAENTKEYGSYKGEVLVLRNGCDAQHWRAPLYDAPRLNSEIAIFQGGINARLDYSLIDEIVSGMPDWKFWFCGHTANAVQPYWDQIKSRPNVQSFGQIHPDMIARLQARASVGIIPFQQNSFIRVSLPLKAYEYVASGLPVVTVPILELTKRPDLFDEATNAREFIDKIRIAAATRWMPARVDVRLEAARANSYDTRFEELLAKAGEIHQKNSGAVKVSRSDDVSVKSRSVDGGRQGGTSSHRKRVLVAYSASGIHVQTTADYLASLARYIDGEVQFVHVTNNAVLDFDFDNYDAVFQNYCVRWPYAGHVSENYAKKLAHFKGVKVLAVQDEYDRTNNLLDAIERVGYDIVLTCIPPDQVERVYPRVRFPNTDFVQVLTGYVPEDLDLIQRFSLPLRERPYVVGYRGRDIGPKYGRLGFDKLEIGRRVRDACERLGVKSNIDWTNESRIYGHDWFRFMGACRATLGTESGSNVFDFDGAVERLYQELTDRHNCPPTYEEFLPLIRELDEAMDMGQISPKFFEAATLRTPLVLLRGRYADMLEAETHYIPLERDYSNVDDVLERLNDFDAIEALADRTYEHLVGSGRFSYKVFVEGVDALIEKKLVELKQCPRAAPPRPFESLPFSPPHEDDIKVVVQKATPAPHHYMYHNYQQAQIAANQYSRHIQYLEDVYPEEIKRLNRIIAEENNRLTQTYTGEINRIHESYKTQIANLMDEIARLESGARQKTGWMRSRSVAKS